MKLFRLGEGGLDGAEHTGDAAGQCRKRGDKDDADERDDQRVLDERLALFVARPVHDSGDEFSDKVQGLPPKGLLRCPPRREHTQHGSITRYPFLGPTPGVLGSPFAADIVRADECSCASLAKRYLRLPSCQRHDGTVPQE